MPLLNTPALPRRVRRAGAWLTSFCAGLFIAWAVVACGGASSVASVGSGGTGTVGLYTVGTITGFGSVFVNGVRFEDTGASVNDEDGARSLADLRLGMVVRVKGSANASGNSNANSFSFDSELLGPVRSINTANKTLVILGQTVAVDANTVFDASLPAGFSSLQVAQIVEVHGYLNTNANVLQATFLEVKNNPNRYKISGTVANLQSTSKTFQIGQETVNFNGVGPADVPPGVVNGQVVKVRLIPAAPNANGQLQAGRLRSGDSDAPVNQERVEIEGLVSAVTSSTQFRVGGVAVDARSASFPNGSAGLVVGARLQVKGSLVTGTLVATEVKVKPSTSNSGSSPSNSGTLTGTGTGTAGNTGSNDGSSSSSGSDSTEIKELDLRGSISSVNTSAKTFVLRGLLVSYSGTVLYDGGVQTNLVSGAAVQVKGQNSITSSTVTATRIRFEN